MLMDTDNIEIIVTFIYLLLGVLLCKKYTVVAIYSVKRRLRNFITVLFFPIVIPIYLITTKTRN